jgi:hypothetical protein
VGALITVGGFVIGIALMASSGVQVLIPETGKDGRDWLADAQDAGDLFVAGRRSRCSPGSSRWSRSSASTTRYDTPGH